VQKKEEEGKLKQILVYFASEALSGSKIFYSEMEKIAYAVIMAARKLRHYFEGHRIRVITNQPLSDLFANREASTRIINWGAELSEYVVDFERRSAIKSQVLADFVVDWTSLLYGPPWAHYLGGYQDRLLGGPLGVPDLRCTTPNGVKHKDYRGEVLG
jgi:hypothetical protein